MEPLPLPPPQDSEPAPVKLPKESSELPQEFELQPAESEMPQEFEENSVHSPLLQETPPRLVRLDTAAKLAHKLLEQWYKESGKHANNDDSEATAHGPPRPGLGEMLKEPIDEDGDDFESFDSFYDHQNLASRMPEFDPSDLSQYGGRYVPAIRPTESEPLDVTQNYVIVKTYKSDDEEDSDAHGQRD